MPENFPLKPGDTTTIEVAPLIMLDAIATWGLAPWDLALTFGAPSAASPINHEGKQDVR